MNQTRLEHLWDKLCTTLIRRSLVTVMKWKLRIFITLFLTNTLMDRVSLIQVSVLFDCGLSVNNSREDRVAFDKIKADISD